MTTHPSDPVLESFFASTPMMMGVVELLPHDIRHVRDSASSAHFFGVSEVRPGALSSELGVPAETIEQWLLQYRYAQRTGGPVHFEYLHVSASGEHWLSCTVSPIRDAGDHAQRFSYVVHDVTRQKQTETEFQRAASRLRVVIENMNAAILVEDETRRIRSVNARFCEMLGLPFRPEAMIGMNCENTAEETKHLYADPEHFPKRLDEVLKARQAVFGEVIALADGRTLERDYVPIFVSGHYTGHLWAYRDITERKRIEREMLLTREGALAASRAKSMFLATMSHEIRTPMNAILGMAELALDTNLSPDQRECLEAIQTSGAHLMRLLNDVLDLSKIEAGKVEMEAVSFSLRDALQLTLRSFAPAASGKGLALNCSIADDLPDYVRGDPTRLRQVLSNLLSNAIKFTERGTVDIEVAPADAARASTDQSRVRFSVRDTGIGIPFDAQDKIFDAFVQVDGSHTRRFEGTGLGLAISQRLVGLMGGTLGVLSQPGKGARFTFTVPLPAAAAPAALLGDLPPAPTSANGIDTRLRILVAEDNPLNARMLTRLLGAMNHDVTVVTNGRLAVEASAANTFDVVLMDVQMPEMDGIEATLQIRARERETGAHLRIIALTANAMAGDASKYLSVGMDGYLVKPVDRERLGQALETVGPDDDFLIVPPHGEPSDSGAVTLDEETAALFLIECPKWLGEMEGALLASDPRALAQAAHKARGALLTLAAAQPAAIAAALETLANGGELEQAAELLPRLEESLRRMSAEMMSAVISTQARPGEGFSAK